MKPSQITVALPGLIKAGQPTFLWGAPGVGKSQLVAQVAESLGLVLKDVRAVLLDPVDLRGLPHINGDGRAHWATPDFLPKDGAGVLFLDELNAAPPLVQNACLQLVLDRSLGEYRLPDGWQIVAAGNRAGDRVHVTRMSKALESRFTHLDVEVDNNDWNHWALASGKIPIEVIAFLRHRPALLHNFEPNNTADHSFPCPRTWEFASRIIHQGQPAEIELQILQGTVGAAAAAELSGFLRIYRNLPNPDAILMNPDKAEVPTAPDVLFALSGSLARLSTKDNFDRVCTYAKRLPADFQVLLVKDATTLNAEVQHTRAFAEWAAENSEVLF